MDTPIAPDTSFDMRERCEKLHTACIDDPEWMRTNHPLLSAGLWRQCSGETPVVSMVRFTRSRKQKQKEEADFLFFLLPVLLSVSHYICPPLSPFLPPLVLTVRHTLQYSPLPSAWRLCGSLTEHCKKQTCQVDIMKRATKGVGSQWAKTSDQASTSRDPFQRLYEPADDPDAPALTLELAGEGSSLCALLGVDRSKIRRKFIMVKFHSLNGHVDRGSRGWYNFGALSSGYDYVCHSSSNRRAYVKGCAVAYEMATNCPERSFADIIDLLDDPNLLAFVLSQDVFTYRADRTHEMKAHPKILPLPLGVNFRDAKGWVRGGEHFQQLVKLIVDDRWERDHLVIARDSQAYQRQALHLQMRGKFGDIFEAGNNKDKSRDFYIKDLAESRFILSPPGWGSDCYRHWEALLIGIMPLVIPTSISSSGGLAHTPVLIYDDLSTVTPDNLQDVWHKVITTPPKDLHEAVAPAFQEYWTTIVQDILTEKRSTHLPSTVPLQFKFHGRQCGNHTLDAAAQLLEHQRSRYAFLKLSANVQAKDDHRAREYCECPCQCGLCEPDALTRNWKQLDGLNGNQAKVLPMYRGTAPKHGPLGGQGGDGYHAHRCPLFSPELSDLAAEPCTE